MDSVGPSRARLFPKASKDSGALLLWRGGAGDGGYLPLHLVADGDMNSGARCRDSTIYCQPGRQGFSSFDRPRIERGPDGYLLVIGQRIEDTTA